MPLGNFNQPQPPTRGKAPTTNTSLSSSNYSSLASTHKHQCGAQLRQQAAIYSPARTSALPPVVANRRPRAWQLCTYRRLPRIGPRRGLALEGVD
eukprot:7874631-Pyramimonas_sp.AAC.1